MNTLPLDQINGQIASGRRKARKERQAQPAAPAAAARPCVGGIPGNRVVIDVDESPPAVKLAPPPLTEAQLQLVDKILSFGFSRTDIERCVRRRDTAEEVVALLVEVRVLKMAETRTRKEFSRSI